MPRPTRRAGRCFGQVRGGVLAYTATWRQASAQGVWEPATAWGLGRADPDAAWPRRPPGAGVAGAERGRPGSSTVCGRPRANRWTAPPARDLRATVYGWLAFTFELCRQRVLDPTLDAGFVADTSRAQPARRRRRVPEVSRHGSPPRVIAPKTADRKRHGLRRIRPQSRRRQARRIRGHDDGDGRRARRARTCSSVASPSVTRVALRPGWAPRRENGLRPSFSACASTYRVPPRSIIELLEARLLQLRFADPQFRGARRRPRERRGRRSAVPAWPRPAGPRIPG